MTWLKFLKKISGGSAEHVLQQSKSDNKEINRTDQLKQSVRDAKGLG